MTTPKVLTREEIEQMRGWIRLYYVRAGHEASAHLSDSLCDMALSALAHQSGVVVPLDLLQDVIDKLEAYKKETLNKYPGGPLLADIMPKLRKLLAARPGEGK